MEKYNEKVFHKKAVFKDLAMITGKHLCWCVLFNENASLEPCNFLKKRFQHRCSSVIIAKNLRTPVLKNICERLFKRYPTWINNITSIIWSGHFLKRKKKKHSKTRLDEKTCLFMMLLIIWFFYISLMYVRRRLPYIIKDSSK